MSGKPGISIIIPVYDTGKYIGECLDSVTRQTMADIEIICVDDGSRDNSPEILHRYAQTDSRIRILTHKENKGLLAARKSGVRDASGEYIMFVDSDDAADPDLCRCVYSLIREHQTAMLWFSAEVINLENGTVTVQNPVCGRMDHQALMDRFFAEDGTWNLWRRIYRTDLCKKAYSEIPDLYCYAGEDALTSFYLTYLADSCIGVETDCRYRYYYGRGISSAVTMPLKNFEEYCRMSRFEAVVNDFLEREGGNEAAYAALQRMMQRLLNNCYNAYTITADEEKAEALDILIDSWAECRNFPEMVKELLLHQERRTNEIIGKQKSAIDQIYDSASYRLGNFLISPLSRIKRTLRKRP